MLAWEELVARGVFTCPQGGWRPTSITAAVEAILTAAKADIARTEIGRSFEGRPITLLTVGEGPTRVLMWSQMHGDEPTHTSVLLNLLQMLADEHPLVERLLRGLTIGLIAPLNPDGAELVIRHNAQGIDVNRDAQRFATPEARAFRGVIESFQPDYGFNLHNQNRWSAVGDPPEPASVSVLVPPRDPEDTQTESVKRAVSLAATFCERIRDRVGGRLSRYPADYMPRAFGEWVQRQGVSVMLIEAGAWPGGAVKPLEDAHFAAFVQTLDAIAATALGEPGGLEESDPASYFDLSRSSGSVYDLTLHAEGGVAQLPEEGDEPIVTPAGLGVNFPGRMINSDPLQGGVIASVGDLSTEGGTRVVEAKGVVLPGRIVLAEPSPDAFDDAPADWETLSAKGATTTLIPLNLADESCSELLEAASREPLHLNAALVLTWSGPDEADSLALERLAAAIGAGAVATIGKLPAPVESAAHRAGLPMLERDQTPIRSGPVPGSLAEWLAETRRVARALGWGQRGRVGLRKPADLVVATPGPGGSLSLKQIEAVFVGGVVVRDGAGMKPDCPGQWL